ncbi:Orn/Lys/Arg decarboxylase N-terminal domain-containing protein [Streptomyces sp. NPDC060022]|uniref:Orn/Lys/Arg family decarboxylase n=1 Tax=Streptomyces sp. NPDC060022 TaxID=3347039 RepID=UPI0036922B14
MALFITPDATKGVSSAARRLREIHGELERRSFDVRYVGDKGDLHACLIAEMGVCVVVLDSATGGDASGSGSPCGLPGLGGTVSIIREQYPSLPVFVLLRESDAVPETGAARLSGYIPMRGESGARSADRLVEEAVRYQRSALPPFFAALLGYDRTRATSWHTPGHSGGAAFHKSPAGRSYAAHFGVPMLRSDLSVSVAELGSLMERSGPVAEAEANAARVFGADDTFFVLNGNSTANRIVGQYGGLPDERALVDRNCHKSIEHALVLSGVCPDYLIPTRNGFGLVGPVTPAEIRDLSQEPSAYVVLTNSTYDGLCYDARQAASLLGRNCGLVHFDEAWFAHAHFHPLYRGRYGMASEVAELPDAERPSVVATQSTHKMLAALSQCAMIHIRSAPSAPVEPHGFRSTVALHASTSPFYPFIASLDVASAMMDGPQGRLLMEEAISDAIAFRKDVSRARAEGVGMRPGTGWFFDVWQPPGIRDTPVKTLLTDPGSWLLEPGADWHGFDGLEDDWCLLDPTKVTVTCPGVSARGSVWSWGLPAFVVTAFLAARGIVVEKTDPYSFLVLFSVGTTADKPRSLLAALHEFKELYDGAARIRDVLPELARRHPLAYHEGRTLPELCDAMHDQLTRGALGRRLAAAFSELPKQVLTPQQCYRRVQRTTPGLVPLTEACGHMSASMVAVTPPGIPVLMPGELIGARNGPLVSYLRALEAFDLRFPGFIPDTHGITRHPETGAYLLQVL